MELRKRLTFGDLDAKVNQFIDASVTERDREKREKEEQIQKLNLALTESRLREKAARVLNLLPVQPLDGLVLAIQAMGENLDKMPQQILSPVKSSLYRAIETSRFSPFQGHQGSINSVAFSPDGKYIVSGSVDRTLRLWDLQGNPIGQPFQGHQGSVNSVAFSPDGKYIVSGGGDDKTVRLWDLEGHRIGQPFQGHKDAVRSVAFSCNGQWIVTGSADKTVRLWDIEGNPIGQPFQGHEGSVNAVAFSPDGKYIVSGSADKTVRLWDIEGNPIGQPFQGHEGSVNSVAFSPDGKYIVSGSWDKNLCLWDLEGNLVGQPLQGHERSVFSVTFSPDGKYIVSGSADSRVRLWLGSWQAWLQVCCNRLLDHSAFKNPQEGSESEAACTICQKYVWNANAADEFNQKGVAKMKQQDFGAAIADFHRAIHLNSNGT